MNLINVDARHLRLGFIHRLPRILISSAYRRAIGRRVDAYCFAHKWPVVVMTIAAAVLYAFINHR